MSVSLPSVGYPGHEQFLIALFEPAKIVSLKGSRQALKREGHSHTHKSWPAVVSLAYWRELAFTDTHEVTCSRKNIAFFQRIGPKNIVCAVFDKQGPV